MKTYVIYHDNCSDGFTAAWAARLALGDLEVDYVPAQYGHAPPDVEEKSNVYVLDFSYKLPVFVEWLRRCKPSTLTVLDHHATAMEDLKGLPAECLKYGVTPHVVFDMQKSGARLAWEHFVPFAQAPSLVAYVEDRDLWKWELPLSREVSAAIGSYERTWENWDRLHHARITDLADEGEAILRAERKTVASHVRNAREVEIAGHKVLAVNATTLTSEIAGELAKGRPFGACYFDRGDGMRVWSLRSRDGGIDVSEVAKRFGGGGHRNAAGYQEAL